MSLSMADANKFQEFQEREPTEFHTHGVTRQHVNVAQPASETRLDSERWRQRLSLYEAAA